MRDILFDQYVFYAKYHKDKTNRIIHLITLPLIVWSAAGLLAYAYMWKSDGDIFAVNLSLFTMIIYGSYYIYCTIPLGIVMQVILFLVWITSNAFTYKVEYAYIYELVIQVIAWILQLIGHQFFEHNKPAFLTSVGQAFVTAPIFILIESLIMMGFLQEFNNKVMLAVP